MALQSAAGTADPPNHPSRLSPGTFDPVIHAPHRLRICAMLDHSGEFEFSAVREVVGVSDSVLSKQLAVLMEAGYVQQRRGVRDTRQRVWLSLTDSGRRAFQAHVQSLRALLG